MDIRLKKKRLKNSNQLTLNIGGSKSESNRLLLLKQLFPSLEIENISPSKDTDMMSRGLHLLGEEINVGDAGTAMRFLTAYYACCTDRKVVLTGSERMQQRPIGILVEALRQLGASIDNRKTYRRWRADHQSQCQQPIPLRPALGREYLPQGTHPTLGGRDHFPTLPEDDPRSLEPIGDRSSTGG